MTLTEEIGFSKRHAVRHVAVERVVGRRLIGDDVRHDAAAHELRQHDGGVALERNRAGDAIAAPAVHAAPSIARG